MKPFSKEDDQRLREAGRRYFSTAFPNPDRIGCPSKDILKAMAARRYDREKARQWHEHMSHCSPCFNDFVALREGARRTSRARWIAVAAAAVVVLVVAAWVWLATRGGRHAPGGNVIVENVGPYKEHLLDFRYEVPLRGSEKNANKSPVQIPRGRLTLSVYLPVGSEPGRYEVQVLQEPDHPLAQAEGNAELRDHIVVLTIKVDLTRLAAGLYLIQIRQDGLSWSQYPALLK
jgi:hypothetical protein